MKAAVEKLLSLGFHVIPCNADKTPKVSWKKYMKEKPTIDIFKSVEAIAILGGNGLEILDIDTKYHASKDIYNQFKRIIADNIYKDFLIIQTPSGGYHYYYFTDIEEGNKKLSQNIKKEVLFETRGKKLSRGENMFVATEVGFARASRASHANWIAFFFLPMPLHQQGQT